MIVGFMMELLYFASEATGMAVCRGQAGSWMGWISVPGPRARRIHSVSKRALPRAGLYNIVNLLVRDDNGWKVCNRGHRRRHYTAERYCQGHDDQGRRSAVEVEMQHSQ